MSTTVLISCEIKRRVRDSFYILRLVVVRLENTLILGSVVVLLHESVVGVSGGAETGLLDTSFTLWKNHHGRCYTSIAESSLFGPTCTLGDRVGSSRVKTSSV